MKAAATLMALTIRPLRVARMRVEAVERDRHRVGREALGLDLAAAAAVDRVGAARAEARDVEVQRPAADLLVRRERDPDGPCGISGWAIRCAAAVTISATPALLSAPSSVVPEAVTMSWPI